MFQKCLVLLIEVDWLLAELCNQSKFKPIVVFCAEARELRCLFAIFHSAAVRHCNDIARRCRRRRGRFLLGCFFFMALVF